MTQDDKGKGSSRQARLKLALRENLKRRKSQARGRNDSAAASSADGKASLDDAGDEGPVLGFLKHALGVVPADFTVIGTPIAVVAGLTYNFLPFMILPLYVALEKIDPRLIEAANDLYANRWAAFRRVTFPLALPGVFAGSILTFIPALGDYVNATLLGNPQTQMIGNVIQGRFLVQNDYPVAAALSFILMAAILIAVTIYARLLGTEQLTG